MSVGIGRPLKHPNWPHICYVGDRSWVEWHHHRLLYFWWPRPYHDADTGTAPFPPNSAQ